jgi:hypothetical protein
VSLPNHLDAYDDCLDYFEQALTDPIGLRLKFEDYGQANLFTMRMHQARALQRTDHQRIYSPEDPRWGRSDFDRLMVRKPQYEEIENAWWVYIERGNSRVIAVEPLSEGVTDA